MSYLTLTAPNAIHYEIKKSSFNTAVYPVNSRADALGAVDLEKQKYPDARHHCWAYVLGNPAAPTNQGYNDDGEPSGTAGKPILNIINHSEFGNVVVIVSRYFGGIKLGAGGLVRAYSQATKEVLKDAQGIPFIPTQKFTLACRFEQESWLRAQALSHGVNLTDFSYAEQVICQAEVPEIEDNKFFTLCKNQQIVLTQD